MKYATAAYFMRIKSALDTGFWSFRNINNKLFSNISTNIVDNKNLNIVDKRVDKIYPLF